MKILSVFSNGNEIAIHNNHLGRETIFYNGTQVSKKFSMLGTVHHFDVQEGHEWIEFVIKVGYNSWGAVSANVWRNGEPILMSLRATYESCRPQTATRVSTTGSSYHQDLV